MERGFREKKIIQTSVIGIIANILLAGFKAVVGFVSNSVAVTMDALNNVTDATSSIITIVGTKLAGKQPDKKHPFGHGRVEYISALIIAGLVLYAGITALIESVKKIISPEEPSYSMISIIIIAVAVIVKIVLGLYVKKSGENVRPCVSPVCSRDDHCERNHDLYGSDQSLPRRLLGKSAKTDDLSEQADPERRE